MGGIAGNYILLCSKPVKSAQNQGRNLKTLKSRNFMETIEHINRIELQGRVGTVRTNEYNGSKVANFSMITETLYKNREGAPMADSMWHNIVFWSNRESGDMEKIVKGAPVNVVGRLRVNRYTAADGTEKLLHEVLAQNVTVLQG